MAAHVKINLDLMLSNFPSICRRYDEIADHLGETPTTTAEIVALGEYLTESQEVTVVKLKLEIDEAANRLMFLLDYANLPCKLQWNSSDP